MTENLRTRWQTVTLLLLVAALPALSSPITFAQFQMNPAAQLFVFTNNGDGTGALSAQAVPVLFSFSNVPGLPPGLAGQLPATLTLNATAGPASSFSGVVVQQILGGTLSFSLTTPFEGSTNLLTATWGESTLTGSTGGNALTLYASQPPGAVSFTSDFLSFQPDAGRALAFSFSSAFPATAIGAGGTLASFTAAGTGTFSAEPGPTAIPEPGHFWLLLPLFGVAVFAGLFRTGMITIDPRKMEDVRNYGRYIESRAAKHSLSE